MVKFTENVIFLLTQVSHLTLRLLLTITTDATTDAVVDVMTDAVATTITTRRKKSNIPFFSDIEKEWLEIIRSLLSIFIGTALRSFLSCHQFADSIVEVWEGFIDAVQIIDAEIPLAAD